MALGHRHLAVRSRPYRRPGAGVWRMLMAAGLIATTGFGARSVAMQVDPTPTVLPTTILVRDAYSGLPLSGARIMIVPMRCPTDACAPAETTAQGVVARAFTTDPKGEIRPTINGDRVQLIAAQREYDTRKLEVPWPPSEAVTLALRPTWLEGRVTIHGEPLPNARVQAIAQAGEQKAEATTDDNGRYRITGVPDGASLYVDAPNVSRAPHAILRTTILDLALRPDTVSGVVRNAQGKAVSGLTVAAGDVFGQTDADGRYSLAGVTENATLIVKGAGYRAQRLPLGNGLTQDVIVQPFIAKGLYVQAENAADPAKLNKVLDLVATKDLNTLVVDLKDNNGVVFYDSKVPLAREVGAVQPLLDVPQLLKTLHDRNVYAIARVVVMEDPIAAVKRPDLAIKDARTGKVWRTTAGQPWLNPTNPQVWQYISDIGKEAADLGFDEVQFDYVRFPSDGVLSATEYGSAFNGGPDERRAAITGFLTTARAKIAPTSALMGADIFGITAWIKSDNGIGQQFEDLAALVDVICPMDYPSHFNRGFNGWDIPNNFPYEVIKQSIRVREQRVPGVVNKTRPWLQAFNYGPGTEYSTPQIFAQIQACNEAQSSGYLLWNITSDYKPDWLPPKG